MSAKELIDAILLARAAGLKPGEVRQWVDAMTPQDASDEDVGGTLVEVEEDYDDDEEDDGADESVLGFK